MLRHLPPGRITPSRHNIWVGTPVDGSPWTQQQLKTLSAERPGWKNFDTVPVKLRPEHTNIMGPPPAAFTIQCPIVARTSNQKRALIVTPGGILKWVSVPGQEGSSDVG